MKIHDQIEGGPIAVGPNNKIAAHKKAKMNCIVITVITFAYTCINN